MPCSNAAKTRNPLKFAGVPQTTGSISAASGPKFTILWGHVEEVLLFNKFFPIVDTCLICEDIARQSCGMVPRWRLFGDFLRAVFSASRVQHVSDLHSKFTLRPHHVCISSSLVVVYCNFAVMRPNYWKNVWNVWKNDRHPIFDH